MKFNNQIITTFYISFVFAKNNKINFSWRLDVVVITTAQLQSVEYDLRFCAGLILAHSISKVCAGEKPWEWLRLEMRRNALLSVNHSVKTVQGVRNISFSENFTYVRKE